MPVGSKVKDGERRGDFYWTLAIVTDRVKEFVDCLGSKYDIKWINRKKNNQDMITPKRVSFMDELETYKNMTGIK